MHSHQKNLTITIFVHIFSYGLLYVVNLIMAQVLPPLGYGDMSIIMRTLMLVSIVGLMGADLGARKFLVLYLVQHKDSWVRGYLAWAKKVLLTMTLIISMIAGSLTILAWFFHKIHFIAMHRWHPLVYALYLTPLVMISTFLGSLLNASGRFFLYILPEAILSNLFYIGALLTLYYAFDYLNVFLMIVAIGVERLLVIVIQVLFLILTFPSLVKQKVKQRSWLKQTLPLMQIELLHMSLVVIDIIMVELLSANENDVGYFSAIGIIAHSILIFNHLFFPILSPSIHPLLKSHQTEKLQSIVRFLNGIKLIGLSIILVVILVFGKVLLSHFGEQYVIAYVPLVILSVAFTIIAATDSAKKMLLYGGGEQIASTILRTQFILTILLNIILIPLFGFMGAAISMLASTLISRPIMVYYAKSRIKIGLF